MHMAALQLTGRRDMNDLILALKQGEKGRAGQDLKKMRKLHVEAKHRGAKELDHYVIERFIFRSNTPLSRNQSPLRPTSCDNRPQWTTPTTTSVPASPPPRRTSPPWGGPCTNCIGS